VHKTNVPAGQPRTLRSIAEKNIPPANLESDIAYDAQAGMPSNAPGAGQRYEDVATQAQPPKDSAVRGKRSFDSNCSLKK